MFVEHFLGARESSFFVEHFRDAIIASELPPLSPLGLKWGLLTSMITAKQHSNRVGYIT